MIVMLQNKPHTRTLIASIMSTQAAPTLQALGISSPHDDALMKKKRSSRPSSRSSSRNASPTETHSKTFVSATLDQENRGVNSNNNANSWKPAPVRINHEVDTTLLKKSSSGASLSKDAAPTVSKPGSRRNSGQPRKVLGDLSQNNSSSNATATATAAPSASGADFMTQAKKPKSSKAAVTATRAPAAAVAAVAPKNPEPEPSGFSLDETMVASPDNEDENKATEAVVVEKQVLATAVADAAQQEEAPKDMTKAFKWERPIDNGDDEDDDDDDVEEKPKAKEAEEFKEEELDEDELDMGAGIVTDPTSQIVATTATTTSTPPKGRVSPPCPPATVAAADPQQQQQQQQEPGALHHHNSKGLDQGLDSLVAAFAASNFEASSDVTASTTAQSSPSVKAAPVAAAPAVEAAPVPEAGNWISEELEARLKEKEIYEVISDNKISSHAYFNFLLSFLIGPP